MANSPSSASPEPRLNIDVDYDHLVDAQFLRRMLDEELKAVHGDGWITTAGAEAAPGELVAHANYSGAGRVELLVALDRAVAHLVLFDLALHVRIAAADPKACEAALEEIRRAMPPDPGVEEEVPVSFWWWQPRGGGQEMGRMIPAPNWQEISANYSARTIGALEQLMSRQTAPTAAGRLILWHGAPGTGKTTAVRALAREWRDWADFHFITDPECFLETPSYLLGTIAGWRRPASQPRWRVLVLEDSGEFLAPDAKHMAGQALSRLLNVCDGVLGQATRSIVLVTTNEHVRTLHSALARPGRCLAEVEFHDLDAEEIARWCGAREIAVPASGHATLAELFAHADGRLERDRQDGFGFAAAAA